MVTTTIKTVMHCNASRFGVAISILTACNFFTFTTDALAADWLVTPTLRLGESYTDNVRLAPAGKEESDFISSVSPGLSVTGNGQGLKFKANYDYQYLYYANNSQGKGYHHLDATTKVTLARDWLFFDGAASIGQQPISAFGTQTTSNYNLADNQTTVKTFTASPYLRHDFNGWATSELRYTHQSLGTGSDTLSSSSSDSLGWNINSDPSFRQLAWGLNARAQQNRMARTESISSSTAGGNLRYMVTPQFYLTATAGYDKYDYISAPGASNPSGKYYTGGFSWSPTNRTNISASAGKKFYGNTYSLSSSVRSRATLLRLSYDESIMTTQSQFALNMLNSTSQYLNDLFRTAIPDDTQRQLAVDQFILSNGLPATLSQPVSYLTNQFFLQKSLTASVAITGARNTLLFNAFNIKQNLQSNDASGIQPGFTSVGNLNQLGFNATWNLRITPLTTTTVSAYFSKSKENSSNNESQLRVFRAAVTSRIQPKVDGIVELRHTEQSSVGIGSAYTENAVSAFVSMKF
ncbi:MAG: TIGR03016 family PEP-CTERM system-associated outer membrane protein [Herbaspirillum sp.]